jgi:hypothetical protein
VTDDDKTPLEQAIDQAMDAFVYAPIGLLLDGPELFPKLAEKGRTQVQVARMMGQMAVQMGQSEAEKRMSRTQGPLRDALAAMGIVPPAAPATPNEPARPEPSTVTAPEPTAASTPSTAASPATRGPARSTGAKKATAPKRASAPKKASAKVTSAGLGIADYDSLSASQVVKRLQGMAETELDAIRAYEAATRARKTILSRISQLQKG